MIGIYKITNPNQRVYIGQSVDIARRFLQYTQANYKKQVLLKRSFEKYGINNHIFEIIEECSFEELNIRERYWQDYYDVLNGGLNCLLTETNELPRVMSQEIKDKISNSLIGKKRGKYKSTKKRKLYDSKRYSARKINQFDLNNNLIKIWDSFQDIVKIYPENEKSIWRCLSPSRQKTSIGFIWSFV